MKLKELLQLYRELSIVALMEFPSLVEDTRIIDNKLRLFLVDGSYIDVWLSIKRIGTYAFHWERRSIDGSLYRYDNIPDRRARRLRTFPRHLHEGSEEDIVECDMGDEPKEILRAFLRYVEGRLRFKADVEDV